VYDSGRYRQTRDEPKYVNKRYAAILS